MNDLNLQQIATPDIIKNLPEFHGDSRSLNVFISCVDPVANIIALVPQDVRPFWLGALRNKIKGRASERLRLYGEPNTWDAIRTILREHFTDNRDQRTLYNQLNLIKQNNLPTSVYYDRILEIVTALNAKCSEEINANLRQLLIDRNMREGLETFINGAKEPLKTILLSRNPRTMSIAFSIANEISQDYHNSYNNQFNQNNYLNRNNNYPNRSNNTFHSGNNHNYLNRFNNPFHNGNNNNYPNRFNNTFHNGNNHNNFNQRPNNNTSNNNPTPMEVDQRTASRRTYQNGNNKFNRNANIYAEELFHNENFQETQHQQDHT